MEGSNITYWINPDQNSGIYASWHGKYTRGHVSVRGTRVWFMPSVMELVYSEILNEDEVKNENACIADATVVLDWKYDGSNMHLDSPFDIADALLGFNERCRFRRQYALTRQTWYIDNKCTFGADKSKFDSWYFVDKSSDMRIWRLNDRELIPAAVKELEDEVAEYLCEHDVELHWV